MHVDNILEDAQFGHIYIKIHARATRYTFRPANDGTPQQGLLVTAPVRYSLSDLRRSIEENRMRLVQMLQKPQPQKKSNRLRIDWNFSIFADCLHISLVKGVGSAFSLRQEPGQLQIVCPPDCDFDAEGRQEWLEKVIVEGLRKQAKIQLIPKMKELAKQHVIALQEVKINNSKGHWGSCSHHKKRLLGKEYYNINLSLYTLLLPLDVQRLILLHELCHTRHMDHSPAFHHDLDEWLCGQEQALELKLKNYSTTIFSFATTEK